LVKIELKDEIKDTPRSAMPFTTFKDYTVFFPLGNSLLISHQL